MMDFLNSPAGTYLAIGLVSILAAVSNQLLHGGIKRVEDKVSTILPAEDALKVNDFLDAVDKLAEYAVQDANSRMVIGLKASGAFTPEVAASVKNSVVNDVLVNLGPLVEKGKLLVGSIESIVSKAIEKHVLTNKDQVNALVQAAKTKAPA